MQCDFGSTIVVHRSKAMKSQFLYTVWCDITGEAAGEVWTITHGSERVKPFTPKFKKYILPIFLKRNVYQSEVLRIGSIIIFYLSKLWKAKFFIPCGVIPSGGAAGEIYCAAIFVALQFLRCITSYNIKIFMSISFVQNWADTAGIRFSTVRLPRFRVRGYYGKWSIPGQFPQLVSTRS